MLVIERDAFCRGNGQAEVPPEPGALPEGTRGVNGSRFVALAAGGRPASPAEQPRHNNARAKALARKAHPSTMWARRTRARARGRAELANYDGVRSTRRRDPPSVGTAGNRAADHIVPKTACTLMAAAR